MRFRIPVGSSATIPTGTLDTPETSTQLSSPLDLQEPPVEAPGVLSFWGLLSCPSAPLSETARPPSLTREAAVF